DAPNARAPQPRAGRAESRRTPSNTNSRENPMKRVAADALSMAMLVTPALGHPFPAKPVRTIIPYSAGSGPDTVMRLVGEKLARAWGQQLVVENRPSGNGRNAIAAVKQALAEG